MTLQEMHALKVGDYVASALDVPEYRVRRVTDKVIAVDGSWVRVKIASYAKGDWISPEAFTKVPTMRTPDYRYKNGDVLAPEHRGENA